MINISKTAVISNKQMRACVCTHTYTYTFRTVVKHVCLWRKSNTQTTWLRSKWTEALNPQRRARNYQAIKYIHTYTHIWHTLAAEYVKKSLLLHNFNLIALNGRNVGQRILSSPLAKEMNRKFVQLALVTNKSRADIKKLIPIIVKIKVRFNFQLKNLL